MKHLGDITQLDGAKIPKVDIITGGSPCQDLSVAGKREGLAGERSGLFMEQIRVIKEMRESDRANGRTNEHIRPRYMVWENVQGAFSSPGKKNGEDHRGEDFQAVLTEIVKIAKADAPDVPLPKGRRWQHAGCLMGIGDNGQPFSVAYRLHDAQFWGVPQRRKRISLVADFGGFTAPEILFERESLSRDTTESREEREGITTDAERGIGETSKIVGVDCYNQSLTGDKTMSIRSKNADKEHIPCAIQTISSQEGVGETSKCLNSWDVQSKHIQPEEGIAEALYSGECRGGGGESYVMQKVAYRKKGHPQNAEQGQGREQTETNDTLNAFDNGESRTPTVVLENHPNDSRVKIREDGKVQTLSSRMGTGGGNVPMVMEEPYNATTGSFMRAGNSGVAETLVARDYKDPQCVAYANEAYDKWNKSEKGASLRASGGVYGGGSETLSVDSVVRRLTPLECERLQGFPTIRKVRFTEMTKDEYIAWNINEGHIIVDTEKGIIYAKRGPGGVELEKPKELKGSVVNGYRVVSIRNGNTKMQCRVHRIVWIAEHGVIPDWYVIDHINNDKQDNRLCNLQLLTPKENSTKARKDGLYKIHGEAGQAKITDEVHDFIQYIYGNTDLSIRQLSEIFGISKSRVHQIIHDEAWTDIGEWYDSKGKKHKDADSPRYKALGNSIALPFWQYLADKMVKHLQNPTMGSLFDGIGGFPLVFSRVGCQPVWASEIEEFPIAVTKVRFPDDDED